MCILEGILGVTRIPAVDELSAVQQEALAPWSSSVAFTDQRHDAELPRNLAAHGMISRRDSLLMISQPGMIADCFMLSGGTFACHWQPSAPSGHCQQ